MWYHIIRGALIVAFCSATLRAQQVPISTIAPPRPNERSDARFRLYPTQNIWTFLLLDSSNGHAWQVHYAVKDTAAVGRVPLNDIDLTPPASAHVGRFILQETKNIYNFLLLDQTDGRVWQIQWSYEEKSRGILRILEDRVPPQSNRPVLPDQTNMPFLFGESAGPSCTVISEPAISARAF